MAKNTQAELAAKVRQLRKSLEREKAKSAALAKSRAEALEQQAAAAEILKVISRSPADVQPVFDAIVRRALRLLGGHSAAMTRVGDRMLHLAALTSTSKSGDAAMKAGYPRAISTERAQGRAVRTKAPCIVRDTEKVPRSQQRLKEVARVRGFRSSLAVPMLRDGEAIGTLTVTRKEPGPFDRHQIDLLKTFADQAVVAIENVRLFNETKEALERQTATAEILKVIASSPTDVQPVFDAVARNAVSLCGGLYANVFHFDGELLHWVGRGGASSAGQMARKYPMRPDSSQLSGRAVLSGSVVCIEDTRSDPHYDHEMASTSTSARRMLGTPMLRDGKPIGAIVVGWAEPGKVPKVQEELLKTFADQAVIAIENVRLFNETQEALERQTATAEILKVIASSPSDVQPVFDAIAQSSLRLIGGVSGVVTRLVDDKLHLAAFSGIDKAAEETTRSYFPVPADRGFAGDAVRTRAPVHVSDYVTDPRAHATTRELARVRGLRSVVVAPMVREGAVIGLIHVSRREPGTFTDHQIDLLKVFADQAVIAIENVRLFNETKEALERQTATAEILKVIAGSPTDVQPVFEVIVQSAVRLCGARFGRVYRYDGSTIEMVAGHGLSAKGMKQVRQVFPRAASDDTIVGRVILTRQPFFLKDIQRDESVPELSRQMIEALDTRSQVTVPMLRAGESIGAITMGWDAPAAFDDQQISLLQTFADQAVIAIENVRLFNETNEALERQTASAEVLRVISGARTDAQPVFDVIAQSAVRLCEGHFCAVFRFDGKLIHLVGLHGMTPEGERAYREGFPLPAESGSAIGRAIQSGSVAHIPDVEADAHYGQLAIAHAVTFRAIVAVPVLHDGRPIGGIAVSRSLPEPFSQAKIALLKTFADQAVIAIENVRLFNETKEALERQTATAEVLRVISNSPTDTQPVFEAIAQSGLRLFPGAAVAVGLPDGDQVRAAAIATEDPELAVAWRARFPTPLARDSMHGTAILERRLVDVPDAEAEVNGPMGRGVRNFLASGNKAITIVPMIRGESAIGAISVIRLVPGPLKPNQIALLQTFADQAVIAIENVRLFNETKEALERQTATAEVLRVISNSPTDTGPVFDAIVRSCQRLFSGQSVIVALVADGTIFPRAGVDASGAPLDTDRVPPWPLDRDSASGVSVLDNRAINLADLSQAIDEFPRMNELAIRMGYQSGLWVPLRRGSTVIGVLSALRRTIGGFTEQEMSLAQSFADQAVIAIENVRMFNETREALERQTATAEILKVIASSPADVQPVFDAIVNSVAHLFGRKAALRTVEVEGLKRRARSYEPTPDEFHGPDVVPLDRRGIVGLAILEGRAMQWADTLVDFAAHYGMEKAKSLAYRSIASAPLMRDGKPIGVISVSSPEPGVLSDKQMALLATFADQAVIAIENVRLFKELEQRTEALTKSVSQLTALGEVGQAISSTLDLEKVLKTIVAHAVQLTGLDGGSIYEYDEAREEFRLQAADNQAPELLDAIRSTPIRKGDGTVGGTAITLEATQVHDILDESYQSTRKELLIRVGYRAVLTVPLVRDNHIIGALSVTRKTPGPFAPEVVELLKTFATQSAMAIQNARLFREIAEKGKQLEEASKHKSHFLASMSHELRTPLNAILGFNEMILGDVYGEVPADMKEPLSDMHTSGKHLLRLINNVLDLAKIEAGRMELALSDYSVQDAVEGVRSTLRPLAAEKGLEFVATVPADIPLAYGDSGRITQCLMNLAGNSLKFTKAGKVEISVEEKDGRLTYRVVDTGIGIPPDKIASLFTEFKQTDATIASEYGGTGLGLSISKKFIEMHGGRIWVESELGSGSQFIFEVPLRAGEGQAA